jgi:hypothetical protein
MRTRVVHPWPERSATASNHIVFTMGADFAPKWRGVVAFSNRKPRSHLATVRWIVRFGLRQSAPGQLRGAQCKRYQFLAERSFCQELRYWVPRPGDVSDQSLHQIWGIGPTMI